jgi:ABC-2 type transport system ATP-binding protein
MGTQESVLSFDAVSKRYRTGDFWRPLKARALHRVSFELRRGEVFGLVGLNGAGKSTLMKTAVGLLNPDEGAVRLFGLDPRDREARRRLGYLPELPYFPGYLSACEVLLYYGRLHQMPRASLRKRVLDVLEKVGLSKAAFDPIHRYSKGMQQRVGLAQTLLHDPELLLLDEPMSGLDPLGMKEMRDVILGERAAGKTIFFNSHGLAEVERICDRVGVMHRGRLVLVDGVPELLRRFQSHVTLGFEGPADLEARLKGLPWEAVHERGLWRVLVPNASLGEAVRALEPLAAAPPSVLGVGSPLETAFLWALAQEEGHA